MSRPWFTLSTRESDLSSRVAMGTLGLLVAMNATPGHEYAGLMQSFMNSVETSQPRVLNPPPRGEEAIRSGMRSLDIDGLARKFRLVYNVPPYTVLKYTVETGYQLDVKAAKQRLREVSDTLRAVDWPSQGRTRAGIIALLWEHLLLELLVIDINTSKDLKDAITASVAPEGGTILAKKKKTVLRRHPSKYSAATPFGKRDTPTPGGVLVRKAPSSATGMFGSSLADTGRMEVTPGLPPPTRDRYEQLTFDSIVNRIMPLADKAVAPPRAFVPPPPTGRPTATAEPPHPRVISLLDEDDGDVALPPLRPEDPGKGEAHLDPSDGRSLTTPVSASRPFFTLDAPPYYPSSTFDVVVPPAPPSPMRLPPAPPPRAAPPPVRESPMPPPPPPSVLTPTPPTPPRLAVVDLTGGAPSSSTAMAKLDALNRDLTRRVDEFGGLATGMEAIWRQANEQGTTEQRIAMLTGATELLDAKAKEAMESFHEVVQLGAKMDQLREESEGPGEVTLQGATPMRQVIPPEEILSHEQVEEAESNAYALAREYHDLARAAHDQLRTTKGTRMADKMLRGSRKKTKKAGDDEDDMMTYATPTTPISSIPPSQMSQQDVDAERQRLEAELATLEQWERTLGQYDEGVLYDRLKVTEKRLTNDLAHYRMLTGEL